MSKKYVITNGESYVCNKLNTVTKILNKAKVFDTFDLANNVFKSSISKSLKQMGFQVRETEIDTNRINNTVNVNINTTSNDKINFSYTEVDIDDLRESINGLSEKFTTLKGNKEWLLDEESNIDKQISDILHYIEFYNFSASDGYKLCKALKELRLRRRDVKNELELIGIISTHTCNNIANGNTNKAIDALGKKQYAPRVLNDLFVNRDISSLLHSKTE